MKISSQLVSMDWLGSSSSSTVYSWRRLSNCGSHLLRVRQWIRRRRNWNRRKRKSRLRRSNNRGRKQSCFRNLRSNKKRRKLERSTKENTRKSF